jgi:hypothetical protein
MYGEPETAYPSQLANHRPGADGWPESTAHTSVVAPGIAKTTDKIAVKTHHGSHNHPDQPPSQSRYRTEDQPNRNCVASSRDSQADRHNQLLGSGR